MRFTIPAILLCAAFAGGATLPTEGPVPELLDNRKTEQEVKDVPLPQPQPEEKDKAKKPETEDVITKEADRAATPEAKPVKDAKPETEEEPAKAAAEKPDPVEREDPEAYAACIGALKASGAVFRETATVADDDGCGIDKPIVVTALGNGVKLAPEGTMRCATALALRTWLKEGVAPTAQTAFGKQTKLKTVNQASTYICRLRNNAETGKISEHARGNAVDIASLEFEGADPVEMAPRTEDSSITGAFQRTVNASACLYFRTVLSPGSDAAHETHLHLDVLDRDNDYRYCR